MKATCDPAEIQHVQAELAKDPNNVAIGVIDVQSGRIHLYPFDETNQFVAQNCHVQVMAGHEAAATMAGLPLAQCRGFVLGVDVAGQWQLLNRSHLNRADGNGHRMDPQTFAEVIAALARAGLVNPALVP